MRRHASESNIADALVLEFAYDLTSVFFQPAKRKTLSDTAEWLVALATDTDSKMSLLHSIFSGSEL